MDAETQNARKIVLGWKGPVALVILIVMSYSAFTDPISTLKNIVNEAPILRLYPAEIFVPMFVFTMFVAAMTLVLKAIPVSMALRKKAEWCTLALIFGNVPLFLFAVLVAHPLQQYYFPKHGYTQCDQLHGNPTIWFTDWVKNPAWCVRGKDRSWVFEQARIAQKSPSLKAIETKQ